MESATFKFNGRQISLNVDKATPNLVVRLLKVPGSKFALTSEEGDCVEPKGQEYFSEKLEPGSTYTVLDLNNEPACPRSQSSVQEVTFVHEDESGRKLLWKTNPQGLAFGQIARHYCLDPETMIVLDSEGTPFENSSSLQLQSGMEYQVHGSPVPNDQPSGAGYSQVPSFHSTTRLQQQNTIHSHQGAAVQVFKTISLSMDHDSIMVCKRVEQEKYWDNLASVVNIVGIVEVLSSIRLSLHNDIDITQEYSFDGFEERNVEGEVVKLQIKSARRALDDISANIQDVYTFTRNKMNEMEKCLNQISKIVIDSMDVIMKLKSSSENRRIILKRNKEVLEKTAKTCATIVEEIVAKMSKTIERINQLASCLAAESATEKRVNKAKIEKEENVEKQEALSQERDRDLEDEDLVRYLRQCSSHLDTTKDIMNQQFTVFNNIQHNWNRIREYNRNVMSLLYDTANAEHFDEAEYLYNQLYNSMFEVGSVLLGLNSYTRVYAKIDKKYIMEPMTEVLKRSAQLSLDPKPRPISLTNPETTSAQRDIREELQAIRNGVAEHMSPFTKKFEIKFPIDQ